MNQMIVREWLFYLLRNSRFLFVSFVLAQITLFWAFLDANINIFIHLLLCVAQSYSILFLFSSRENPDRRERLSLALLVLGEIGLFLDKPLPFVFILPIVTLFLIYDRLEYGFLILLLATHFITGDSSIFQNWATSLYAYLFFLNLLRFLLKRKDEGNQKWLCFVTLFCLLCFFIFSAGLDGPTLILRVALLLAGSLIIYFFWFAHSFKESLLLCVAYGILNILIGYIIFPSSDHLFFRRTLLYGGSILLTALYLVLICHLRRKEFLAVLNEEKKGLTQALLPIFLLLLLSGSNASGYSWVQEWVASFALQLLVLNSVFALYVYEGQNPSALVDGQNIRKPSEEGEVKPSEEVNNSQRHYYKKESFPFWETLPKKWVKKIEKSEHGNRSTCLLLLDELASC